MWGGVRGWTLGFVFCANSLESGKFTLETKHSAGVSAAGLGFHRPGCSRRSRRQRAKSYSPSSKFGQRDKVRASGLPGVASMRELAPGLASRERASTPDQVRSGRRGPPPPPAAPRPQTPRGDASPGWASRAGRQAPLTLHSRENRSASVTPRLPWLRPPNPLYRRSP